MNKIISIIKGVVISYIITIILIMIFSFMLVNTNIKEEYINTIVLIISCISILIGTSISTMKIKKNGILNGIIISFIYMFGLYICSSILNNNFSVTMYTIAMFFSGIILGVVGGIIGVNIKS